MAERIVLCVGGLYGSIAVVVIIGLVALVRYGSVRVGLAAVLRVVGRPTLRLSVRLVRWLAKAGDHDGA